MIHVIKHPNYLKFFVCDSCTAKVQGTWYASPTVAIAAFMKGDFHTDKSHGVFEYVENTCKKTTFYTEYLCFSDMQHLYNQFPEYLI